MQATPQNIQPNALINQANWCFRTMRNCTDPQLTAELSYMGSTLRNKARKESQPAERNSKRQPLLAKDTL